MESVAPSLPANGHVNNAMLLKAMKLLAILAFVGWLVIWVMMPTSTYANSWAPRLASTTNSKYFGTQGTNILIFTFPILFISVVGCVYLHLTKKHRNICRSVSPKFAAWKRPMLVTGPLGIVTGIEFTFCFMFLVLLAWSFGTYSRVGSQNLELDASEKLWQSKLYNAALNLGLVGNLCCAFLFFPVTRGSSLLPLLGLTSESSIKYHMWLGNIVMLLFTAHGTCFVVYWATTNQLDDEMLKWYKTWVSNVAGEIALLCGLAMWVTCLPSIRRKMFELFYYTHQLYVLFLLFYVFHVGVSFFCFILPGVYLFMLDRYLRFLQSRVKVQVISARILPSAIELVFSKSPVLSYNPLSVLFINIPSISSLQWHPFTVTSSSTLEPDRLSIIIKKEGSWSQKLHKTLAELPQQQHKCLDVAVEGPYGPASVNFLSYDTLVMVSGGSGITPFISIIRELISISTTTNTAIPTLLLISAFKNSSDLAMLRLLLPAVSGNDISIPAALARLDIRVEAFVTQEKAPSDGEPIKTVLFDPSTSNMAIAPVLGANGWLWLAAVLSASFVTSLALVGVVQRYYIYPIDGNTEDVYSWPARAAMSVALVCVAVFATASAAFLWKKKANAKEAASKVTAASMQFHGGGEVESLVQESLVQATRLHFGTRPNIKKMLLDIDGSNIGVMASGPRGMRQEVAGICSLGSANHLHFASISFTW